MTTTPRHLATAIVADPRARLPLLQRFFAAYFHQDWYVETPRWQDAVEDFANSTSPQTVAATVGELRELAGAALDEATLAEVLEALDCSLVPSGVGLNATSWVEALVSQLDR
ncbi:MAG: contact-dependent growth inhibition system immunity protein [Candidatus Dormibacteria bacterium]